MKMENSFAVEKLTAFLLDIDAKETSQAKMIFLAREMFIEV